VMAGEIVLSAAAEKGVEILPVDSEHSAIFQCLQGHNRRELDKIILTASGGPFRTTLKQDFLTITPKEALNHPTWSMGEKISIDSATLMNKCLEAVEAKYLFNLSHDQIEILVHPESIVHSMVAYIDGSMIAQLGTPDMKTAIAYAMSWPSRLPLKQALPDFSAMGHLTFEAPDFNRFPSLGFAQKACEKGGSLPAVMNAANEAAVPAFLDGRLAFPDIFNIIEAVMEAHHIRLNPTLSEILDADAWARQEASDRIEEKREKKNSL